MSVFSGGDCWVALARAMPMHSWWPGMSSIPTFALVTLRTLFQPQRALRLSGPLPSPLGTQDHLVAPVILGAQGHLKEPSEPLHLFYVYLWHSEITQVLSLCEGIHVPLPRYIWQPFLLQHPQAEKQGPCHLSLICQARSPLPQTHVRECGTSICRHTSA